MWESLYLFLLPTVYFYKHFKRQIQTKRNRNPVLSLSSVVDVDVDVDKAIYQSQESVKPSARLAQKITAGCRHSSMKEQAQPDSSYTLLFVSLAYLRHITLRSGFGADPLSVGRLLGPARRPESRVGANIS